MKLPYSDQLDIQHLSRLFDNMSECYKLFWFQAIVDAVILEKEQISYNELIDRMVADAWYMVSEYRLNLGPKDTLEELVHYAFRISGLKSSEKREKILEFLKESSDKELLARKRILTLNVPYRLQAPFMPDLRGKAWDGGVAALAARINKYERLMYYFVNINGLQSEIRFDKDWMAYIIKNREIIKGQCH